MMNTDFKQLTKQQKKDKLRAALLTRTENCLTESELDDVIQAVSPRHQVSIVVHFQVGPFQDRMALSARDYGHVILGRVTLGIHGHRGKLYAVSEPAAVLLHRAAAPTEAHELHIYIPKSRKRRRPKHD